MKTKLLKKLRAKARKTYWIEYRADYISRFWIIKKEITGHECSICSYGNKKDAIKRLNEARREYILSQLRRRIYD